MLQKLMKGATRGVYTIGVDLASERFGEATPEGDTGDVRGPENA